MTRHMPAYAPENYLDPSGDVQTYKRSGIAFLGEVNGPFSAMLALRGLTRRRMSSSSPGGGGQTPTTSTGPSGGEPDLSFLLGD